MKARRTSLLSTIAALAMSSLAIVNPSRPRIRSTFTGDDSFSVARVPDPIRLGRRAEKDAVALQKAEAKRQRRAAKRLADARRVTA